MLKTQFTCVFSKLQVAKRNYRHLILQITNGLLEFLKTYPELSHLKKIKSQYLRRTVMANIKVVVLVPRTVGNCTSNLVAVIPH